MINRWTSSKAILAKVYRNLQMEEDRTLDMVEWIGEALGFIGAFPQYVVEVHKVNIVDYKAVLPCNLLQLIQVYYKGYPLLKSVASFPNSLICCDLTEEELDAITAAKIKDHVLLTDANHCDDFTYTIDPCYIKTSIKTGELCLVFTAYPLDEDKFPLVPDDESYADACVKYIVMKLKYLDWIENRISDGKYAMLTKDWEFSCMQARANANMPSLDDVENIKRVWIRLLPEINHHKGFFRGLNEPEKLNL